MLAVAESGNAPAGSSTIGGRYIMQVDTGHLVDILKLAKELQKEPDQEFVDLLKSLGYVPVPNHLKKEAQKELAGKTGTHVNLDSNTELAKWATERRNKRARKRDKKRKNKRNMVKASRRKNRK